LLICENYVLWALLNQYRDSLLRSVKKLIGVKSHFGVYLGYLVWNFKNSISIHIIVRHFCPNLVNWELFKEVVLGCFKAYFILAQMRSAKMYDMDLLRLNLIRIDKEHKEPNSELIEE
jgi:hypothetical protein